MAYPSDSNGCYIRHEAVIEQCDQYCADPSDSTFQAPAPADLGRVTSSSSTSSAPNPSTSPFPHKRQAQQLLYLQQSLTQPTPPKVPPALTHLGLSTGAKVEIGAGLRVAVLLLSVAILLDFRRSRSQKHPINSEEEPEDMALDANAFVHQKRSSMAGWKVSWTQEREQSYTQGMWKIRDYNIIEMHFCCLRLRQASLAQYRNVWGME
ncbi:MAG: hypothetical protein Q9206_006536 [Seirophora lacunosa]